MDEDTPAEPADDQFFAALIAGDADAIRQLIDDRFLIIDVMSGTVADGTTLVGALQDQVLEFERIDLIERASRYYGDTAIVVGRTQMAGSFAGTAFATSSRYTHVFVRGADARWRLAGAQGTPITEP